MAWLRRITGSDRWYIEWREGGVPRKRSTGTPDRKLAERILAEFERKQLLRAHGLDEEAAGTVTSAALLSAFLAAKEGAVKPETLRSYRYVCAVFARFLGPQGALAATEISKHTLAEFWAWMRREGYTETTVKIFATTLKACFGWGVEFGFLARHPERRLPRVTVAAERVRVLTMGEIEQLLAHEPDVRTNLCYRFMLLTGARIKETCAMRWTDVDFVTGMVYLRAHTRKSGKPHEIEMHDVLREVLEQARALAEGERVWPYSQWETRKRFGRAREAAGLSAEITPHCLRHTAAAHWLSANLSLYQVKELLGHSSVAVTERSYGHLLRGQKRLASVQTPLVRFGKIAAKGTDGQ